MENSHLSFWEKESFLYEQEVIIIGSGIVGLSAAVALKEQLPKLSVLIVERGDLPMGASTKNAGFACFGSVSELLDDLQNSSEDEVFALVEKRWKGLEKLRSRLGDVAIDYIENGGFELFGPQDHELFRECQSAISYFNTLLKSIIGINDVYNIQNDVIKQFGFQQIDNIILNKAEGQIDSGKMMRRLLDYARNIGVEIQTGINVDQLQAGQTNVSLTCHNGWRLQAKNVILATNGFTKRILPELDVKAARNQVLITKPINGLKVKGCFHYDKGYYYFRNINNRIMFGGGRHLSPQTEFTDQFGNTGQITKQLDKMLKEIILPDQDFEVDYYWSGILGIGSDKNPIVRKLNGPVYAAVKLGGMGIAIGSLAGEEVANLLINNL